MLETVMGKGSSQSSKGNLNGSKALQLSYADIKI